jgi:hypothetical protein
MVMRAFVTSPPADTEYDRCGRGFSRKLLVQRWSKVHPGCSSGAK